MRQLELRSRVDQNTGLADESLRISNWIRNVDDRGCDEVASKFGDNEAVAPVTPKRRLAPRLCYEETSPTDSSFSRGSIFDTPQTPRNAWSDDPFCDNVSIATSVGHEHEYLERKSTSQVLPRYDPEFSQPCSVVSVDPPSELDQDLEDELGDFAEADIVPPSPAVEPGQPRIVRLASCLQCTLAGLPCSKSVPACSRCKRAGKPETCLLYRQKFSEEIRRSDGETCTALVLLKLKNENPASWQLKLSVEKELHTARLAQQDRDNWVLPPICSPRGNFRSASVRILDCYPGGNPRDWVHRELHVDTDL